jgi:RNA polymerase primary sigma factor
MAQRELRSNALDAYMDSIGRIPLMTPEEEIHLGKLVRRMMELKKLDRPLTRQEKREVVLGERAKNRFVQANLRLVVYIVKRNNRKTSFLQTLDLIQECSIGLIRAVEMFDPQRGYKFSTYAYWWCRQAISRTYTAQERAIRRPVSVGEMAAKVEKVFQQESARLGRAPDLNELAKAAGVKRQELDLLATRGTHCVSLDALAHGDESSSFLEFLRDESIPTADDLFDALDSDQGIRKAMSALEFLNDQERHYVTRRYGLDGEEPAAFADLAKESGVTRERVRQITQFALMKMRLQMTQKAGDAATAEAVDELAKEVERKRRRTPRKCDQIDPQVLQEAREAWSSPALQSA